MIVMQAQWASGLTLITCMYCEIWNSLYHSLSNEIMKPYQTNSMQILVKGLNWKDYIMEYMRSNMSDRVICVAVYSNMHLSLTADWPKHITHLSLQLTSFSPTWQQQRDGYTSICTWQMSSPCPEQVSEMQGWVWEWGIGTIIQL